jgi:hypothetical protein
VMNAQLACSPCQDLEPVENDERLLREPIRFAIADSRDR